MVAVEKKHSAHKKASYTPRILAKRIASFASDKKAEQILILDMRPVVHFCDYFVICSGTSDRHVKAVANGIEEGLASLGVKISHREGLKKADWIVFDIGDILVHVFLKDLREFYGLEHLWQAAKEVKLS